MKVAPNIKAVIRVRLIQAANAARDLHDITRKASLEIYQAAKYKVFKLTPTQIKKVERLLLNGCFIGISDIHTTAQSKATDKAWDAHTARERSSGKMQTKILNRMRDLERAIMADLELCCCEDEQRAVVAKFAKHDIDKPWKIQAMEHHTPTAK